MTLKRPTAIVFDWDNTLVDSWGAIAEAINYVRGYFGLPQWSHSEIKTNCTRAARDSFPEWFGDNWQKAYEIYYDRFDAVRKQSAITPLAGASEIVHWLKEQKIPAFVVSNKNGNYLRLEAAEIGWTDFFKAIIGAQDAAQDKPSRDPVNLALNKGGIKASTDIWFVGDSGVDMECACNAGLTPIFIGSAAMASRLSVAHYFQDCNELLSLLYNTIQ